MHTPMHPFLCVSDLLSGSSSQCVCYFLESSLLHSLRRIHVQQLLKLCLQRSRCQLKYCTHVCLCACVCMCVLCITHLFLGGPWLAIGGWAWLKAFLTHSHLLTRNLPYVCTCVCTENNTSVHAHPHTSRFVCLRLINTFTHFLGGFLGC